MARWLRELLIKSPRGRVRTAAALRSRALLANDASAESLYKEAIAHLASPRSRSTTGTSLAVDGGLQNLRLRPVETQAGH